MSDELYLPPATAAKMASAPVKGGRHQEAIEIATPLIGNGFSPNAVFQQLRDRYPSDVTDKELSDIVRFVVDKKPSPSGFGQSAHGPQRQFTPRSTAAPSATKPTRTPTDHAAWWLSGLELTEESFLESSPLKCASDPKQACLEMLELLYGPKEFVNIVSDYTLGEDGKANPKGGGKTRSRELWCWAIAKNGVPQSEAGAWIRPNPGKESGSGADGAYCDSDIVSHRFILIESDVLPMAQQLALYSKLKLHVSLVVSSGGKSVHAWVMVGAKDGDDYKGKCKRILNALKPFGIDGNNKNPSRLSRLVGATRIIQANNSGLQKLLYLDPKTVELTEDKLAEFEASLEMPAIDDLPMKAIAREAVNRYTELYQNQGRLGVPTGIYKFDRETGGLKDRNFIVIAADTGGGKSTLALNWINHAVSKGIGVALFSIEMDRDEIFDNLMSINLSVNRNLFNTGEFKNDDIDKMTAGSGLISNFPLWIFDDAIQTVESIRKNVTQLKSENKISLVVVDYIQIVTAANASEMREQQVAGIANGLRAIAKDLKVPLVGLSQLNEDGKIRESRVIAHAANVMLMMESLEKEDGDPRMRTIKGRRIKKNTYPLYFHADYCRLTEASPIRPEDVPQKTPYRD